MSTLYCRNLMNKLTHTRIISKMLPFWVAMILVACSSSPTPVTIERLDRSCTGLPIDSVLNQFGPALEILADLYGVSSTDSALAIYSSSAAQMAFGPDVTRLLPELNATEKTLGEAKEFAATKIPAMKFPTKWVGYITPYRQSVVLADSVILIGLNHYLGTDYPGYAGFENYQRQLKTPDRMAQDAVEALIYSQFPFKPDTPTTLQRMIYEGAVLNAVASIMPSADMPTLLGCTAEQTEWLSQNEGRIWAKMIDDDILYSSDPAISDRLISPAPSTQMINAAAPGRVGRYIGLQIVRSFMEKNPETAISHTLTPEFYNSPKTLADSGYLPN